MLRSYIRVFVSFSVCLKFDDMIARTRVREVDLEHLGKRKAEKGQTIGVLAKKPNGFNSRSRDQHG